MLISFSQHASAQQMQWPYLVALDSAGVLFPHFRVNRWVARAGYQCGTRVDMYFRHSWSHIHSHARVRNTMEISKRREFIDPNEIIGGNLRWFRKLIAFCAMPDDTHAIGLCHYFMGTTGGIGKFFSFVASDLMVDSKNWIALVEKKEVVKFYDYY